MPPRAGPASLQGGPDQAGARVGGRAGRREPLSEIHAGADCLSPLLRKSSTQRIARCIDPNRAEMRMEGLYFKHVHTECAAV